MADLPKLNIDNPGGDWLINKLEAAQEDYQTAPLNTARRNLGSANVTGSFPETLNLSPQLLKDFPGATGEEGYRPDPSKLDYLKKSIEKSGYSPSPILIHVREDGKPFVVEGNHRIIEALQSGRSSIPVELKYLRGAESAEGPLSPDRLREVLQQLPTEQSTVPETSNERFARMARERLAQLQRGEYFPTTEGPEDVAPQTSSERLIKLRQAAGDIPLPEEGAAAEAPPTTPLAPRPNLPAVVDPEQARPGRGIGSFVGALGKRLPLVQLAQAARQGWELLPEETKADARDLFSSMNEPWDPFGLELGLPEEEIVEKINKFGEGAWNWIERQFGAGEPEQEPTGIATLPKSLRMFPYDPEKGYGGSWLHHGGPHGFTRFKISKVGTGEGQGAFHTGGPSGYFTEIQTTGSRYRKTTSQDANLVSTRFGDESPLDFQASLLKKYESFIEDNPTYTDTAMDSGYAGEWTEIGEKGVEKARRGDFKDRAHKLTNDLSHFLEGGGRWHHGQWIAPTSVEEIDKWLNPRIAELEETLDRGTTYPLLPRRTTVRSQSWPSPDELLRKEILHGSRYGTSSNPKDPEVPLEPWQRWTAEADLKILRAMQEAGVIYKEPGYEYQYSVPESLYSELLVWEDRMKDQFPNDPERRESAIEIAENLYTRIHPGLLRVARDTTLQQLVREIKMDGSGRIAPGELESMFREAGIPGHYYLEAMSRPEGKTPEAQHNVVIWDQSVLDKDFQLSKRTGEGDTEQRYQEGGFVHGPLSVNPDMLEYGMDRTPSERLMRPPRTLYANGGLASLPQNPVLGGQEHMLAYITPEEAASLREQGGGVTPDGGQYTGPGGIASFYAGAGAPAAAAAAAAAAGTGTGHGGQAAGPGSEGGSTAPGGVGDPSGPGPGHSGVVGQSGDSGPSVYGDTNPDFGLAEGLFGLATADTAMGNILSQTQVADDKSLAVAISKENAKKSIIAIKPVNDLYARRARLNDKTMAYADLTAQISDAMSVAVDNGYSPAAISKMNQVANMNVPDIFGNVTLALQLGDQEFNAFDIANMSDADFSALSGNPATTHVNDPDEGFGPVSMAATSLFSMLNPALALPALAIDALSGLSDGRSTGLTSLLGIPNILGDVMGEVESATGLGEVVSNAFSPIQAAVESAAQDVYGFVAPPTHAIAQSLGLHSEPSQFSVNPGNMGPRRLPSQVPLQGIQPPPLQIDHTGPLGTEVHDPLGGDIYESGLISPGFTIDELLEYGIAPVPPTTSMFPAQALSSLEQNQGYIDNTVNSPTFGQIIQPPPTTPPDGVWGKNMLPPQKTLFAHGGFVDKPLYSRS